MSKFEEREVRRKQSIVGKIVDNKLDGIKISEEKLRTNKENKKRISLVVFPSSYSKLQKIAYVNRQSVSDIICKLIDEYVNDNINALKEYEKIKHG